MFDPATGALLERLENPDAHADDSFGETVVGTDDWIAVGLDSGDNGPGLQRGRVDLFETRTGAHVRTIRSPTADRSFISFGKAVAISGDLLFVGAPNMRVGTASRAGMVFVYDIVSGTLLRSMDSAFDSRAESFGRTLKSVNYGLLVGSSFSHPSGDTVGAVFLYGSDGTRLRTFEDPDPAHGDFFGFSIDTVGDAILVGAPEANGRGAAYLLDSSTGALLHAFRRPPGSLTFGGFGLQVAALGDDVVIADPGITSRLRIRDLRDAG